MIGDLLWCRCCIVEGNLADAAYAFSEDHIAFDVEGGAVFEGGRTMREALFEVVNHLVERGIEFDQWGCTGFGVELECTLRGDQISVGTDNE